MSSLKLFTVMFFISIIVSTVLDLIFKPDRMFTPIAIVTNIVCAVIVATITWVLVHKV